MLKQIIISATVVSLSAANVVKGQESHIPQASDSLLDTAERMLTVETDYATVAYAHARLIRQQRQDTTRYDVRLPGVEHEGATPRPSTSVYISPKN